MELYYEGVNITDRVMVTDAICRDRSREKADALEITFSNIAQWQSWKPQANDRIAVTHNGYETGTMYVNAIVPEDNKYRIFATAAKTGAAQKKYRSFENRTLGDIAKITAAEDGMECSFFGIAPAISYQYIQRQNERAAAFLERLAKLEGAVLKTFSGRYTMIGIEAAQGMAPTESMYLVPDQEGVYYAKKDNAKIRRMDILTPYTEVVTEDDTEAAIPEMIVCNVPARDSATASRWGRGLLLSKNRLAEKIEIQSAFRKNWTAMVRIDIESSGECAGKWMIDSVEHDFINETSRATLLRCVETIK